MAARSRTRTPGSCAMHSKARAWLVRKLQLPMQTPYLYFQKQIAGFGVQVYGAGQARGSWPTFVGEASGKKGTTMELLVIAIVAIVAFGLYRFMRTRAAH